MQTVGRFAADGTPLGRPVTFVHVVGQLAEDPGEHRADRRLGSALRPPLLLQDAYLHRNGSHAYTLDPDAGRGLLTLDSVGAAKYWEVETTGRFLASEYRDLSVSYVRSHSTRALNDYDQFFGNFAIRSSGSNENALSPTDVPNRMIVRGTIGLPASWCSHHFMSGAGDSPGPP